MKRLPAQLTMLVTLAFSAALSGCWTGSESGPRQHSTQVSLKLNHVQVIGSHNSYKKPLFEEAKALLQEQNPDRARSLDYSHPSLTQQLQLGLRHLEIDVLLDPDGGRFARPAVEQVVGKSLLSEQERELLLQPGLKVMHVPDVDFASHCQLFSQCLNTLRSWSEKHSGHLPIFVMLNVKESGSRLDLEEKTDVLSFEQAGYTQIDQEISSILGDRLITPDDVRTAAMTLAQSVLKAGWPALDKSRGKFLFFFDGNEKQRNLYRHNHPSLRGRVMFASYDAGEDEAALMIINKPVQDFKQIQNLVEQGYLVRTRSDSGYRDAEQQNLARVNAAFTSGAQIISTDFYPGAPQTSRFDFQVAFSDGSLKRCNQRLINESCLLPE